MTPTYRRRPADQEDELAALGAGLAAGVAVGAVTWYLARTWLRREPLPSGSAPETAPRGEGAAPERDAASAPGRASASASEGASAS